AGGQPVTLAMGALAIDPSRTQTIYAGTGEEAFSADALGSAGLLQSLDGGTTWTRLADTGAFTGAFPGVGNLPQLSFARIVVDSTGPSAGGAGAPAACTVGLCRLYSATSLG